MPETRVSIAEIEQAFALPIAVFPDPTHSQSEERFKAVSRTGNRRHVLIVFTLRTRQAGTLVRPISARFMHAKEIAHYEEAAAEIGDR